MEQGEVGGEGDLKGGGAAAASKGLEGLVPGQAVAVPEATPPEATLPGPGTIRGQLEGRRFFQRLAPPAEELLPGVAL